MNKIISVALLVVTLVITLNALWQLYNYPVDNLYTFLTQMSILGLVVIGQMSINKSIVRTTKQGSKKK